MLVRPESTPRRRIVDRFVLFCWTGYWFALFVMMHLPRPPGRHIVERLGDKVIHAAGYMVLALLGGWWAFRVYGQLTWRWTRNWFVIYCAYAALDELLQPLTRRSCQLSDWLADITGCAVGLAVATALSRLSDAAPE